jgi:hypothetical protein
MLSIKGKFRWGQAYSPEKEIHNKKAPETKPSETPKRSKI